MKFVFRLQFHTIATSFARTTSGYARFQPPIPTGWRCFWLSPKWWNQWNQHFCPTSTTIFVCFKHKSGCIRSATRWFLQPISMHSYGFWFQKSKKTLFSSSHHTIMPGTTCHFLCSTRNHWCTNQACWAWTILRIFNHLRPISTMLWRHQLWKPSIIIMVGFRRLVARASGTRRWVWFPNPISPGSNSTRYKIWTNWCSRHQPGFRRVLVALNRWLQEELPIRGIITVRICKINDKVTTGYCCGCSQLCILYSPSAPFFLSTLSGEKNLFQTVASRLAHWTAAPEKQCQPSNGFRYSLQPGFATNVIHWNRIVQRTWWLAEFHVDQETRLRPLWPVFFETGRPETTPADAYRLHVTYF